MTASTLRHRRPIIALSGFLGAGKTTLSKAIPQDRQGCRTTVIVDDEGEVNIEAASVRDRGADLSGTGEVLVDLARGCAGHRPNRRHGPSASSIFKGRRPDDPGWTKRLRTAWMPGSGDRCQELGFLGPEEASASDPERHRGLAEPFPRPERGHAVAAGGRNGCAPSRSRV